MRRGVLVGLVALTLSMAPCSPALAASDLELRHAADGTLVVVGTGWRPGDRLEVSLGPTRFPAYVDGTGDFEVATGLRSYQGEVAAHRTLAVGAPLPPADSNSSPAGALLAQAMAQGFGLLALCAALLAAGVGLTRRMRL